MNHKSKVDMKNVWRAGGAGLMLGAIVLNLAMLSQADTISSVEFPVLYLTQSISLLMGFIFALILLQETFSASVPMLFTRSLVTLG